MALKQELRSAFGGQFDYETARDAETALEMINELAAEQIEIVLVISDWLMPGIKGDEFLLQARARCPGTCAIMVTGQADDQSLAELRRQMPDVVVIRKPWSADALRNAVQQCLDCHPGRGE